MENKQISAAFVKAQSQFGAALKTSTNPHFKSRYADLSACVEAVIDALNQNGIALLQQTFECESGVMVETVFLHESGEELRSGRFHLPASKQDAQGYGSALTYARRYSLMASCGIAPEDDDGNAASKPKPIKRINEIQSSGFVEQMKIAENMDSLKEAYTKAYKAAKSINDNEALEIFAAIYKEKKSAFERQI